ncbi:MAG: hypothetical protein VR64_11155 [Desulfatitalea sp. BRH_c12]|nr:MAG: hypothetical protein VR64_11155 [Desulfatitalea sp. BRH_c12]
MSVKVIFAIVLAVVAAIFMIQNLAVMDLSFLFWTLSMSRSLFTLLILAVGIGLGWLLHSLHNQKRSNARDNKSPQP